MRKTLLFAGLFVSLIFFAASAMAQCTPDPTVTDPEGNGEMVPDTLYGTELQPMNITLTIIGPSTVDIPPYGSLPLHHIRIKSITNKPAWLSYACDNANCDYNASQSQCALVTGTPPSGSAGTYAMDVLVDVYAIVLSNPTLIATDYNSGNQLILIVTTGGSGIETAGNSEFRLIPNQPNPFSDCTRIGVTTPVQDLITLNVVDMLGNIVYTEKLAAKAGENNFAFTGHEISGGIYFYTVMNGQNQMVTRKMVKID